MNKDQIAALERLLFSNGKPDNEQIELLHLIDSYMAHPCPAWSALMERVHDSVAHGAVAAKVLEPA